MLLGALAATTAQATTYHWVDKDGVHHYSDTPQKGAEKVDLPKAQTYSAPPAPPVSVVRPPDPTTISSARVTCAIVTPKAEETYVNVQSLTVSADGPRGTRARLELNGETRTSDNGGSFVISPVARGTYSATVVFEAATPGQALCRTAPVTFYVQQPSLLNPARPRPPGAKP
jgi:hypothetical protein